MTSRRFRRCLFSTAAAALWAYELAAAQQQGDETNSPNQQQTMPAGQVSANESAADPDNLEIGAVEIPETFVDQMFVRRVFANGVAQVEMQRLAVLKSSSADVKQFGRGAAQIYQELEIQLRPMARRLGVTAPRGLPKGDKEQIARMRTLSGASFDAAFVAAMRTDQQRDLKHFRHEIEDGRDPAVQKLAKAEEPLLSQRLQVLEKLAQSHNVPVESQK